MEVKKKQKENNRTPWVQSHCSEAGEDWEEDQATFSKSLSVSGSCSWLTGEEHDAVLLKSLPHGGEMSAEMLCCSPRLETVLIRVARALQLTEIKHALDSLHADQQEYDNMVSKKKRRYKSEAKLQN